MKCCLDKKIVFAATYSLLFFFVLLVKKKNCPSADFTVTNSNCEAPCDVSFQEITPKGSINQRWDFGDGNIKSQESNPSHKYLVPGTYTVRLIANLPGKCGESIKERAVIVRSKIRPIADFSIENGGCITPAM